MGSARQSRGTGRATLVAGLALVSTFTGCGQTSYTREPPRPPSPIQVTGVITEKKLDVSPNHIGAGPIVLIVSNQDSASHTVILEGERSREQVGPINPQDTGTIQEDLKMGTYTVKAGS
jgi:hypothetical protein